MAKRSGAENCERSGFRSKSGFGMTRIPQAIALVIMTKTTRQNRSSRDLRTLLYVPQSDLQAQVATRLERLGFPALRPAHVQLLSAIGPDTNAGVRLADLVTAVSLPKQTVGDLVDDLETMRM